MCISVSADAFQIICFRHQLLSIPLLCVSRGDLPVCYTRTGHSRALHGLARSRNGSPEGQRSTKRDRPVGTMHNHRTTLCCRPSAVCLRLEPIVPAFSIVCTSDQGLPENLADGSQLAIMYHCLHCAPLPTNWIFREVHARCRSVAQSIGEMIAHSVLHARNLWSQHLLLSDRPCCC